MSDFNVVGIKGRVGKEPQSRSTPSGVTVVSFSIASDVGYGEKKHTNWWDVTVFGKTAEAVDRLVTKGARVVISGSLDQNNWVDKNTNEKKSRPVILANTVDIIDFPERNEDYNEDEPF